MNMFDEKSLQVDQVYSSMISLGPNSNSQISPDVWYIYIYSFNFLDIFFYYKRRFLSKSNIFNAYKPINEGGRANKLTLNSSDFYVVEGDMIMSKSSFENSVKTHTRHKRKIVKETYASGFSSRWPHKLVPYEFDYDIGIHTMFW